MPFPGQIFEAILTDARPDPANMPGHIAVKIPELYGTETEAPFLIPPMFPGWTAGGWHGVPTDVDPDGGEVYISVIYLAEQTFRWLGTMDGWSEVTSAENSGYRSGTRSGDGRHKLYLDSRTGLIASVKRDNDTVSGYLQIDTEGTAQLVGSSGARVLVSDVQLMLWSASGHLMQMTENEIILLHATGNGMFVTSDVLNIVGTSVQLSGGTIEFGGGSVPPTHPYPLTLTLLAAISAMAAEVVAIGLGIPSGLPVPTPNTTTLISGIATSLSAGAPYLSTRTKGD